MRKQDDGLNWSELRAQLEAVRQKLECLEARQIDFRPLPVGNTGGVARGAVVGLLLLVSFALFIGSLLGAQNGGRAFFIDGQGNISVATNLDAGGKIKASTFEGDGAALNLEANKSINAKLDKTGGTISGKLTIAGKSSDAGPALNVGGEISGDNVWTKLHDVQLSSAADYTVKGLNGDAYRWFRIELQGTLTEQHHGGHYGGWGNAIGIRPNGSEGRNDYGAPIDSVNAQWWAQFPNGINSVTNFLPLCITHFRSGQSEGQLSCTGEMNTPTEMFRVMRSESSFVTVIPKEEPPWPHRNPWEQERRNFLSSVSAANFWRDEKTNITSLTLFFGGADGFHGRFILYGKK